MNRPISDECINVVGKSQGCKFFDDVIGHIEDIILSETFQELHRNFLDEYWHRFEDTEENKLEYTDIFQEYTNTFESFLIEQLYVRMIDFDMNRFADELDKNKAFDDIIANGEIFELLHSFNNFETFKELMLDYRNTKDGNMEHLASNILITAPYPVPESTIQLMISEDESNTN